MKHDQITFYLPLEADVELKITVQARYYNGIASDPRTITRGPSIYEVRALQEAMRKTEPNLKWTTTLDYPPA